MTLTETVLKSVEFRDKPYRIKDTGGLFAEIRPSQTIVFRMRYWYHQRDSLLTIGEYPHIKLKQAREKRDEIRRLLANDIDPAALREYERTSHVRRLPTFGEVSAEWLQKKSAESASEKNEYINKMRLEKYILPTLEDMIPDEISAPLILNGIIRPIEADGHLETAHKVLSLCGQIFRFAIATGRATRNPSPDLKGALIVGAEASLCKYYR